MECNHNHAADTEMLAAILKHIKQLERKIDKMAATLDEVLVDVAAEATLIDGLSTLISSLKQQVIDAKGDQAKIEQIFADAEANKAALQKALTDNTPVPPQEPA